MMNKLYSQKMKENKFLKTLKRKKDICQSKTSPKKKKPSLKFNASLT